MSYQFYLVLHLLGVFLILLPLGGIALHIINGGTREYPTRKFASIFHGVGLLIALVGGFGLMAKLGIRTFPLWIIVKLCVWLALGAMPALLYRKRELGKLWWSLILVLAVIAASMAIYKPASNQTPSEAPAAVNPSSDPALTAPAASESLEAVPPSDSPNP